MAPGGLRLFFGADRYARRALGGEIELGSFGDTDLFVGARGLGETVIPDIDDGVFELRGKSAAEVELVRATLFDRDYTRELWNEPSLAMELRHYVETLARDGELFVHFEIEQPRPGEPYTLLSTTWLAPETIVHRPGAGVFEQFASRRAFEGSGMIVSGEPRDVLFEIPEAQVMHLRWPLPGPAVPGREARRLGEKVSRGAQRSLLNSRSGAKPGETFLPLARARAGAFSEALEEQEMASAQIKDLLLYPGANESLAYPWAPELSDYFAAERIVRAKIGICRLRAYLFEQLNRQVLGRWCGLNGWGEIEIGLRPQLFSEEDWRAIGEELMAGTLGLEDLIAAKQIEWDAGLAFGRMAHG